MTAPALGHGLSFTDLYDREGLARLDAAFVGWLQDGQCRGACAADGGAHRAGAACGEGRIQSADRGGASARGFHGRPVRRDRGGGRRCAPATTRWRRSTTASACSCSATSTRAIKPDAAMALDGAKVTAEVALPVRLEDGLEAWELAFALAVRELVGAEFKVETPTPEIEALTRYAAWALHHPEGKKRHRDGPLFKVPHKLDFEHLVPIETEVVDGVTRMQAAAADAAPSRGLRADRRGHRSRRARSIRRTTASGATTRARTRARAGSREGAARRGAVQEVAVRRDARRLPARGEDLGVPQAAARGLARSARWR